MLLFYVRHGNPIYNPDSLTPLGKRQAEAVAKRLSLYGIDKIYSSTSKRAIETATPTSEIVQKEIQLLDFCNEWYAWEEFTVPSDGGVLNWSFADRKIKAIFNSDKVRELGDRWYELEEFSGFKFKAGMERVNRESDAFLESLGYRHNRRAKNYEVLRSSSERIALFAHQGFGLAFLSSILDIPYPMFSTHFDMGHTGVTVIEFSNENKETVPKILTLSNDSHLYREGIPTNYNGYIYF